MANLQNRGFLVKTNVGAESSKDSLLLEDKNFNYSITRYPLDLGTANFGKGHYIVFHILQQRQSQYKTQNNPTGAESVTNVGFENRLRNTAGGGYWNETAGEVATEIIKVFSPTVSSVTPNDKI